MDTNQIQLTSTFQNAIDTVEALSLEEQSLLIEIIQKRLQQQKRTLLKQEVEEVRKEYSEGKVQFGSIEDFIT